MNLTSLIDKKRAHLDKKGIWRTNMNLSRQEKISKDIWEKIYHLDQKQIVNDRYDFNQNKLKDHMRYIENSFQFTKNSIYLEIGCGPAYIAESLMKKYKLSFIGVDFNYHLLEQLKKYLRRRGFKNFMLIHANLFDMPIKNNAVDFIYGGGVIEHMKNTKLLLQKLRALLKIGGVCFNTIPAFNLLWSTRFWNNIPAVSFLRPLFEYAHIEILKNRVLEKYHGYELSYTVKELLRLHQQAHFKNIKIGPFAFHPSKKRLKNKFFREIYYIISKHSLFSPVYFASGVK